jgi:cytochrome c-type biogenesis protein CcmH/NrfG
LRFIERAEGTMENDTNKEILAELRSMRKVILWGTIISLAFLAIVCIYGYFRIQHRTSTDPWSQADTAMEKWDYPKALDLVQKRVAQNPNDYYGHWYLGNIYLVMGDAKKAEPEYARAYELYPSEELETRLETVRKRLKIDAEKNKKPPANTKK